MTSPFSGRAVQAACLGPCAARASFRAAEPLRQTDFYNCLMQALHRAAIMIAAKSIQPRMTTTSCRSPSRSGGNTCVSSTAPLSSIRFTPWLTCLGFSTRIW